MGEHVFYGRKLSIFGIVVSLSLRRFITHSNVSVYEKWRRDCVIRVCWPTRLLHCPRKKKVREDIKTVIWSMFTYPCTRYIPRSNVQMDTVQLPISHSGTNRWEWLWAFASCPSESLPIPDVHIFTQSEVPGIEEFLKVLRWFEASSSSRVS